MGEESNQTVWISTVLQPRAALRTTCAGLTPQLCACSCSTCDAQHIWNLRHPPFLYDLRTASSENKAEWTAVLLHTCFTSVPSTHTHCSAHFTGLERVQSARCLTVYLVEASMEDSLHLFAVERDSLDLAALVFVVEGHSLAGGCTESQGH